MSRFSKTLIALLIAGAAGSAVAWDRYPGIGREATPAEVKAWDIDVRPDLVGLPKGRGNVDDGMALWETHCTSCHGVFGESNEVFTPIVGGTTQKDIETGRVAALVTGSFPQRTTMMKVPTISTLFDYIQRAMPWTAPKSLNPDEVYAILAYLLNLAEVVPADFELSDENIREVQERMPNRNGMTTDHGMWPGASAAKGGIGNGGTPDVKNVACMKDCKKEVVIASALPEYAQDAHGNLAEQNRPVGQTRGKPTAATTESGAQDAGQGGAAASGAASAEGAASAAATLALANARGCMACHGVANKIVGPGYNEIAQKYQGQADAEAKLVAKVKSGGQGVWGAVPMPPQGHVKDEELAQLVKWILEGAKAQ
ncbi:c-type cytochrome [Thauera sp. JM12B12]|uniref:c-type cytochrome n=1 Tax=Thauera sp. JM12B12 TaxID=3142262 RepID=UPI0031F41CDA